MITVEKWKKSRRTVFLERQDGVMTRVWCNSIGGGPMVATTDDGGYTWRVPVFRMKETLQPGESCAFSEQFTYIIERCDRRVGFPQWCAAAHLLVEGVKYAEVVLGYRKLSREAESA
jgi:hypothetical protein